MDINILIISSSSTSKKNIPLNKRGKTTIQKTISCEFFLKKPNNKDRISPEQFWSQIYLDTSAIVGQGEGRTGRGRLSTGWLDNDERWPTAWTQCDPDPYLHLASRVSAILPSAWTESNWYDGGLTAWTQANRYGYSAALICIGVGVVSHLRAGRMGRVPAWVWRSLAASLSLSLARMLGLGFQVCSW
jgi:hypothetical protein